MRWYHLCDCGDQLPYDVREPVGGSRQWAHFGLSGCKGKRKDHALNVGSFVSLPFLKGIVKSKLVIK